MAKNPLYTDKIVLQKGASGGGIFMSDGTSVIDKDGNVDAPVTSTDLTLSGTLAVTGASTLTGAVGSAASITLGAGADLIGSSTSDITINTDKFTVAGATGNTVIAGTTTLNGPLITAGTASLSGAGAIPITEPIAEWTTTSADAGTLADGAEGQRLSIVMVSDGGDGTLTPSNLAGGTTITFDNSDTAELLFTAGAWYFMGGTATVA